MKKKLLPITIGLLSIFFMVSCKSEEPSFEIGGGEEPSEVNKWLYDQIFMKNYLWDVTSSPDYSLSTRAFFNSLLNSKDKASKIWESDDQASYDIGFEYGTVLYTGDNDPNKRPTYIIVFYVKPGISYVDTPQDNRLKRGHIITTVNGKAVNAANAATILQEAYAEGGDVKLNYLVPPESELKEATVKPNLTTSENPLFETGSEDIINLGSGRKIGYMLYNSFTSGVKNSSGVSDYSYDKPLAEKIKHFSDNEIDYLVLDLRYNTGGDVYASSVLASALVKNWEKDADYITFIRARENLTGVTVIPPVALIEKTRGSGAIDIPRLGEKLKGIYIITSQYTAGPSEAFINAILADRSDVKVVGEKTAASGPVSIGRTSKHGWSLEIATAYMADKEGQYNYTNGFSPDPGYIVKDVPDENVLLGSLGDQEESILYAVISDLLPNQRMINRNSTGKTGTVEVTSSSVTNKPWANKSIINLDELK